MPGDESALREALLRLLFPSSGAYPIAAAPQHQEKSFFFVGSIATIAELNTQVTRIAASNSNVLITGETGTGKELVASAIHQLSARSHKPFISLNCAAIPDALAESEFFGHERGAFTGAYLRNQGSLEAAHQGTVFLDEVGDMSAGTQAKLLRVIENKEFRRLGGKTPIKVDVRFIAATNRNLEEMAGAGRFREDLYYRLNIARVHLLPLRERKEDIPILIRHYVQEFGASHNNRLTETDEVWECLLNYDWPGNVRELKNALESAFVNSAGGRISISDLPCEFRKRCSQLTSTCPSERQALLSALLQTKWNKSRAAEQLRWSRMTLYRKMRKYRIPPCSDHRIA
jgi:transcriptional regulator with PAS, ATPase and Fis domain